MIKVYDNKKCCGCNACVQICPVKCIAIKADSEGFLYPVVDIESCINCNLCEDVCPMLHEYEKRASMRVIAARNKDEQIILQSSSGGMFSVLAEYVINESGVVFGARINNDLDVVHDFAETKDGIIKFRGSKYVQSVIGDSFVNVKEFLNQKRLVMFSGTPCQVRGLRNYLNKEYDNLILVDFICHGVSSPEVFKQLILEVQRKKEYLKEFPGNFEVSFRDKTYGWHNYGLVISRRCENSDTSTIILQKSETDVFYAGYGANLFLRPACHSCPSKNLSSLSDLTLADFWGIEELYPDQDDDKGYSLVLINTHKGEKVLQSSKENYESFNVNPQIALKRQTALFSSVKPSKYRANFFNSDLSGNLISSITYYSSKRSIFNSIYQKVKSILVIIGVKRLYKLIRH